MNKRLLTLSTKEDLRTWDKSIRKDINGNSAQIRDLEVKVNRQADLLPTLVREEVVKTVRELQMAPHQSDQQRESFMVCRRCISCDPLHPIEMVLSRLFDASYVTSWIWNQLKSSRSTLNQ